MDEREILEKWYKDEHIVVGSDQLVQVLKTLVDNGVKDTYLRYLGGDGWSIIKIY